MKTADEILSTGLSPIFHRWGGVQAYYKGRRGNCYSNIIDLARDQYMPVIRGMNRLEASVLNAIMLETAKRNDAEEIIPYEELATILRAVDTANVRGVASKINESFMASLNEFWEGDLSHPFGDKTPEEIGYAVLDVREDGVKAQDLLLACYLENNACSHSTGISAPQWVKHESFIIS